jgi:hypothetical protein
MLALAIKRGVELALRWLPASAQRALDAWSYRVALRRRERRLKPARAR